MLARRGNRGTTVVGWDEASAPGSRRMGAAADECGGPPGCRVMVGRQGDGGPLGSWLALGDPEVLACGEVLGAQ
jgi:hypothetical protein